MVRGADVDENKNRSPFVIRQIFKKLELKLKMESPYSKGKILHLTLGVGKVRPAG